MCRILAEKFLWRRQNLYGGDKYPCPKIWELKKSALPLDKQILQDVSKRWKVDLKIVPWDRDGTGISMT